MDNFRIFLRRISRHGLLGTLKLIPVNVRFLWQQLTPAGIAARQRERALDRELGIDTATIVPKGALEAESERAAEGTFYTPVPREDFEELIACLPAGLPSLCFIDIGSGKGRALVLAARSGFAEVIGVELSQKLHRIAEKNLARIQGSLNTAVRILNLDAREFVFPGTPSVVFLANPFGEEIMRQVVANIERAHCNSGAPVFLLYHWPVHEGVLRERGRWREIGRGHYRKDFGIQWRAFAFTRKRGKQ